MKPLVLLLLLIPALCFSQQKKDSKIIVTTSDTTQLFYRVVKAFYQNGYTVDKQDEKNGFISTVERTLKKDKSASIIIKALVSGNTLTFTGEAASNVTMTFGSAKAERTFMGIYFGGMKGSSLRTAWDELNDFAKQFGPVSYSR